MAVRHHLLLLLLLLLLSFYGYYIGQPALASTPVTNWRIVLEQSFTACMSLLMPASLFGLQRRC